MREILFAVLGAFIVSGLTGCGPGGDFPTAPVSGRVMCEGAPVAGAMVYFEPLREDSSSSAIVGKQGFAFTDAEGRFVLGTYGDTDGAVVGKHRVRVGGQVEDCPCVLNEEVDLMEVEIKAGEKHEFELVLPKKTGRERPPLRDEDDEDDL
jgi:hypothetical protein